jgi:hypothetical protein
MLVWMPERSAWRNQPHVGLIGAAWGGSEQVIDDAGRDDMVVVEADIVRGGAGAVRFLASAAL